MATTVPSTPLTILLFSVYVAIAVAIGIYASRRETEEDFMIAERRVHGLQMIATITAGMFDGAILSIYIAYVYQFGFSAMWFFVGLCLGFLLFRHLAFKIKLKADEMRAYSMPEYFYKLLGKQTGVMFSIFLVVQFFGYLVVNFIISGKVLVHLFPMAPAAICTIIGGIIILIYLLLAGFKAVVRTDFYQLLIMVIMTLTVALALFRQTTITTSDFDVGSMGIGNIVSFLLLAGLGILVAPDLWQRVFAARDVRTLRSGFAYGALILPLLATIVTVLGLATKHYFSSLAPEDALVTGFSRLLPYGIKEFGLVLLYAVALSSSDTVTFVVASIFTRDFKNYSVRFSEESMKKMTRLFMILFVVAAMTTAVFYQRILSLAFSLMSLNLALFPVVFGSLFWTLNRRAVFWSLVFTLAAVLILCVSQSLTPETAVLSFPAALFSLLLLQVLLRRRKVQTGAL